MYACFLPYLVSAPFTGPLLLEVLQKIFPWEGGYKLTVGARTPLIELFVFFVNRNYVCTVNIATPPRDYINRPGKYAVNHIHCVLALGVTGRANTQ